MRLFLLIIAGLFLIIFTTVTVFAQDETTTPPEQITTESQAPTAASQPFAGTQTKSSNRLCVKVGTPTEEKPAICIEAPPGSSIITPGSGEPPPTVEAGQLTDTIWNEFGVSMQGPWDEKHLQWIYEKFYELRRTTTFIDYIKGQPVILISGIPNQESGVVQMSQTGDYASDRDYFLGTLIHEFGHVIYHKPLPQNLAGEVNNLYTRINCVSTYSRCQSDRTENYPEVVAYCLNPKAVGGIRQEKWAQYRDIAVRILGFCYN